MFENSALPGGRIVTFSVEDADVFVLAVYEQEYLVGGGGDATDEGDVVRVEFEGEAGGQVVVGVEGPDHVLVVVRHHEPIGPVARHHVQHVTRD